MQSIVMIQSRHGGTLGVLSAGSTVSVPDDLALELVGCGDARWATVAPVVGPDTGVPVTRDPVTGDLSAGGVQVSVSGGGNSGPAVLVSASRLLTADDDGAPLELVSGVTVTYDGATAIPAGVVLLGPPTGTATLAVSGTGTINGGTLSVSIPAGGAFTAMPRASDSAALIVRGA
jgi:hypothetical protein